LKALCTLWINWSDKHFFIPGLSQTGPVNRLDSEMREIVMRVRLLLAALGAVQVINACVMLAAPASWYAWVPGVAMTVRDIGLRSWPTA
jgi:hypothetical protein